MWFQILELNRFRQWNAQIKCVNQIEALLPNRQRVPCRWLHIIRDGCRGGGCGSQGWQPAQSFSRAVNTRSGRHHHRSGGASYSEGQPRDLNSGLRTSDIPITAREYLFSLTSFSFQMYDCVQSGVGVYVRCGHSCVGSGGNLHCFQVSTGVSSREQNSRPWRVSGMVNSILIWPHLRQNADSFGHFSTPKYRS